VAVVQYTFAQKQYTEQHNYFGKSAGQNIQNLQKETYITIRIHKNNNKNK